MKVKSGTLFFLWGLGAPILLGGCADSERAFSLNEEDETFTVDVVAKPSASVRTDGTGLFWFSDASASFSTDFAHAEHEDQHDDDSGGHAALGGGGQLEEGDGHHEDDGHEEGNGHEEGHDGDDVPHGESKEHGDDGETATLIGKVEVSGYDMEVAFLSPQHIHWWNHDTGTWEEEEPHAEHDRYLMVRVGSSAGTGGHPHVHGSWSDPVTAEEEELAEEDFGGMRQVFTGSAVHITVTGGNCGIDPCPDNEALTEVETSHGMRYGGNFTLSDGTYDITVTVEKFEWDRLSDAEESWKEDVKFTFTGVEITNGDGGTDVHGRQNRALNDPDAQFVVLESWDGSGHGHSHEMYLENHMGDSSQDLHDGTNTLVCQLRASSARNLYENGAYIGPQEPVHANAVYIEVVLYDPKGLLHHDDDNFFDLAKTGVEVTVTNDQSGDHVELDLEDLRPTYSHRHGFHYGANIALPEGGAGGADEEEEAGGGHDHG